MYFVTHTHYMFCYMSIFSYVSGFPHFVLSGTSKSVPFLVSNTGTIGLEQSRMIPRAGLAPICTKCITDVSYQGGWKESWEDNQTVKLLATNQGERSNSPKSFILLSIHLFIH